MNSDLVTCPMCGHTFDASEHIRCQACPLKKSCQLICCPSCGFELVDIQRSALASRVSRWLSKNRAKEASKSDE